MNLINKLINIRKDKSLAISIDFIISVSFYQIIYFNKFNTYPNKLVTIVFSIFWLILSYILGRYDQIKKINLSTRTSIAKETSDALVKGYILMVTSAIEKMYKEFATNIKYKPKLIITGPYSREIFSHTSLKAKFEPDFALKCLGIISGEY